MLVEGHFEFVALEVEAIQLESCAGNIHRNQVEMLEFKGENSPLLTVLWLLQILEDEQGQILAKNSHA